MSCAAQHDTRILGASLGSLAAGEDIVACLERIRALRGTLPLVLAHDGGPAMSSRVLADYLARHRVVSLHNRPYNPQHNRRIEHGNRQLRAETGLCKEVLIHDHHLAARCLMDAIRRLNGTRRRASQDMRAAIAVAAALPGL